MPDLPSSRFVSRVAEMLKQKLSIHSPRLKQESSGLRCAIPRAGAFLVVNVTADRVYWESVPAALNDAYQIRADADWETAFQELEMQVQQWSASLET